MYTLVMKKNTLTLTAPATSFNVNSEKVALNIRLNTAYEVDGGWYKALAAFIFWRTGVKVTVRAHGPRMGELFGLTGDLNTLGLHVRTQTELSEKKRREILNAVEFFFGTVSVKRTVLTEGKSRQELRAASTAHGKYKVDGLSFTEYGITTFIVAL